LSCTLTRPTYLYLISLAHSLTHSPFSNQPVSPPTHVFNLYSSFLPLTQHNHPLTHPLLLLNKTNNHGPKTKGNRRWPIFQQQIILRTWQQSFQL
jgi:hypothetical protein